MGFKDILLSKNSAFALSGATGISGMSYGLVQGSDSERVVLEEKIKNLNVRLFEAEGSKEYFKDEVSKLREDKQSITKERDELDKKVAVLETKKNENLRRIHDLEGNLAYFKEENKKLTTQIHEAHLKHLEFAQTELKKIYEKVLNEFNTRFDGFAETLNSRLDSLVQELTNATYQFELTEDTDAIEKLTRTINELKTKLEILLPIIENITSPEKAMEYFAKLFEESCEGKEGIEVCKNHLQASSDLE